MRLAFLPAHECWDLPSNFFRKLNIKLALRKKNYWVNYVHSHYCSQQKKLCHHYTSLMQKFIEEDKQKETPRINHHFTYYIGWHGKDDKASIPVSYPECPLAATTHTTIQAVVPANTEIHHADHDFNELAKGIILVTSDFNIGADPSGSLLSGKKDGYGRIHVEVHDDVFHKLSNFHHVALTLLIVRQGRIRMLAWDKELPALVMHNDYHDLIADHCEVVDSAMPLVFGYEVDGGVDHNNINFQNMCAYIAGAILLRSD